MEQNALLHCEWEWWSKRLIFDAAATRWHSLLFAAFKRNLLARTREKIIISEIREKGVKKRHRKNTLLWLDHSATHRAATATTMTVAARTDLLFRCVRFGFASRERRFYVSGECVFSNVLGIIDTLMWWISGARAKDRERGRESGNERKKNWNSHAVDKLARLCVQLCFCTCKI